MQMDDEQIFGRGGVDLSAPMPWIWRNCRSVWFSLDVMPCPWDWRVEFSKDFDLYGGVITASVGPIGVRIHASIGNSSDENPLRARFAISENTAWERSADAHGYKYHE